MAKSTYEVAQDVISGNYGNGQDRVNALTAAGYNAGEVQNVVNQIVDGTYNGSTSSGSSSDQSVKSVSSSPSSDYATKGNYGSYQYGKMPTYTSKYQDQIDKVRGQIENYGTYTSKYQEGIDKYTDKIMNDTYDAENDPLYMAYKDQYIRGGQKAMQDTMAKAVALSGGFDNSYANSVGQQTYNDYMAGLADKIPELAQLAQNMYTTKLNTLQSLDATDYGRWGDERSNLYNLLNTYNDLESDYYGKWSDEYSNYLKAYEQDQALKAAAAAAAAGGGGGSSDSGVDYNAKGVDYVNEAVSLAGLINTGNATTPGSKYTNPYNSATYLSNEVRSQYNEGSISLAERNKALNLISQARRQGEIRG